MYELTVSTPEEWLNRCSRAYPTVARRLDGLPSDEASLLGELALRANNFETSLQHSMSEDPSLVFQTRQILGSLKKFRFSSLDATLRARNAMDKFEANNAIARTNSIPRRFEPEMRRVLRSVLKRFSEDEGIPTFGPGAVAERMSVLRRWDSVIGEKSFDFRDPLDYSTGCSLATSVRTASRLCAVPKDFDKDRLITVEPWSNTFVQHTVRRCILYALRRSPDPHLRLLGVGTAPLYGAYGSFNGDVGDLPAVHRAYAAEGSRHGTLATLDMKDASDLVSFFQVAQVFPIRVLAALERGRTELYERDGKIHPLYMFGGMGSATTFLVETLMFYSACHAIAHWFGIPYRDRHISVFGDDIVCSSLLAQCIVSNKVFADFGWRINEAKSFYTPESAFRESCGGQYYTGLDVTIARYRGWMGSRPETLKGWVDLIHLLCSSGRYHPLAFEPWETSIPNFTDLVVPGGIATSNPFWPATDSTIRRRYSRRTQNRQVLVQGLHPSYARASNTGLGLVYGALSGQLAGQTEHSRRRGVETTYLRVDTGDVAVTEGWHDAFPGYWWRL